MRELALLLGARARTILNTVRGVREHSRLKIVVLTVFAIGFWAGLFLFFRLGLRFIHHQVNDPAFAEMIDQNLLSLYLFSLFLMLSVSTGLIVQASLFKSPETQFLLVSPVTESGLFTIKFAESLSFSSWVVLFLGTPVFLAYGLTVGAPWWFYAVLPLVVVPFLVIPAALGTLFVLFVGSFLVRYRRLVAVLLAGGFAIALAWIGIKIARLGGQESTPFTSAWIVDVFQMLSFTQHPLLPTRWMLVVVMQLARGKLEYVPFNAGLVLVNAVFLYSASERLAAWRLRRAYSDVTGIGSRKRSRTEDGFYRRAIDLVFFFLPERTRLYLEKDVKSFVRDPVQRWQFLILVGLLFLYILNLRTLAYDQRDAFWRNLIAFLNLGATSLTMTTFASRFVYPLLSLEGKRFWILGVLPIERRSILTGKFVYALSTTLAISEALIALSCYMLQVPLGLAVFHAFTVAFICVGVSGLAVGLGALYPNFRVDDPSKIVSGFGGTLNLVLSLAFILVVVVVEGVACHRALRDPAGGKGIRAGYEFALVLPGLVGMGLGLLTCWIPLRMGARHFEKLEF